MGSNWERTPNRKLSDLLIGGCTVAVLNLLDIWSLGTTFECLIDEVQQLHMVHDQKILHTSKHTKPPTKNVHKCEAKGKESSTAFSDHGNVHIPTIPYLPNDSHCKDFKC